MKSVHTSEKDPSTLSIIEEIYTSALAQNKDYLQIPKSRIYEAISSAIVEINELEKSATYSLTPEMALNVKFIWILSGPDPKDGTNRYETSPWIMQMDQERICYAINLARKIYELTDGQNSPTLIYNGNDNQNSNLKQQILHDSNLSSQKILILGNGLTNTVDQIRAFEFPETTDENKTEIGIVSHSPHLVRALHILNEYKKIPKNIKNRAFPVKTPKDKLTEYSKMEILGLLNYLFISNTDNHSEKTCDYLLNEAVN